VSDHTALTLEQIDSLLAVVSDEELVRTLLCGAFAAAAGYEVPPLIAECPITRWFCREIDLSIWTPERLTEQARILRDAPNEPAVRDYVNQIGRVAVDWLLEKRVEATA
jgi:hypothetical protein